MTAQQSGSSRQRDDRGIQGRMAENRRRKQEENRPLSPLQESTEREASARPHLICSCAAGEA